MYRKILCFLMVLSIAAPHSFAKKPKKAVAEVVEKSIDLGVLRRYDCVRTATIHIKNTGNQKLVIYSSSADCPCVTTVLPKPVKPGQTGVVTVKYDGRLKRPSRFKIWVYFSTSGKPANFRIAVQGELLEK